MKMFFFFFLPQSIAPQEMEETEPFTFIYIYCRSIMSNTGQQLPLPCQGYLTTLQCTKNEIDKCSKIFLSP